MTIPAFLTRDRTAGTVIIAQDRRGSLRERVNRRFHELPHAGNDGHDGNIDIPAGDGKDVVAADRNKAVGQLHDKAGCTEADDIFCIAATLGKFCFPVRKRTLKLRPFSSGNSRTNAGRKQSGRARLQLQRPARRGRKHENKERVKDADWQLRRWRRMHIPIKGISLCVDKRIHAD